MYLATIWADSIPHKGQRQVAEYWVAQTRTKY